MKTTATIGAILTGVAAGVLAASAAMAQLNGPAETPPASFTADEYVDSAGCVYARVALGDEDVWVPRVGPDRQPLCGLAPTVAADSAPGAEDPATIDPFPETEMAEFDTPDADAGTAMPAPQPARTAIRRRMDASAPSGMAVAHAPVRVADLPNVRVLTAEAAATLGHPGVLLPPTLAPSDVHLRNTCPSGLAYDYVVEPPGGCRVAPMNRPDIVHGTERPAAPVSHSPVARLRIDAPTPPAGYRVAWDDGRLNPYRGIRTPEGDAQTRMVWTDTVPRRLVPAD